MSKNKLAIPRLTHFVAMLKENKYPNHPMLIHEMRKMDIAGAYSITQKTLQRDVAFLKGDYNAPIEYDYSRHGYYLTDPTWSWDIPQLNDTDLNTAIIAAHLAESIMPSPFGKLTKKAVDSLLAGSDVMSNKTDTLVRLVACGAGIPVKPEIFMGVFDGWLTHKVLCVNYTRALDGESSELLIEPQILAFYEGCWYLRVKLRHSSNPLFADKSIITIALHRITHVEQTATTFVPCEKMISDAVQHQIFDLPLLKQVKLRLSGRGLRYAQEQFSFEIEHRTRKGELVARIFRIPEYKIINLVFAWPGDVCILEPETLRKKIENHSKEVFKMHRSHNRSKLELNRRNSTGEK